MSIRVRTGKEADLPRMLELVKELARFEKARDEVTVTLDEMIKWGFGTEQIFGFFVLEKQHVIIGIAVYYYKYSTWKGKCLFLEDLLVTETERGNGYGKLLFDEVLRLAKQENVKRMEWQVLNWNDGAIEFYKKYRTTFHKEWLNCRLTEGQIQSFED